MALSRDEIHVWKIAADCLSSHEEWSLLSPPERQRALALRSTTDRERWVRAHAGLRDVLSRYLDHHPRVQFTRGKYGKPGLKEPSGLRFNLAHSGQWALIAIARLEIGIDIEEIRACEVESIAQTVLCVNERQRIHSLTGRQRLYEFYRAWTRKEALLKGLGLGLNADPSAFNVLLDRPPHIPAVVSSPLSEHGPWVVADIDVDERHRAAVAVRGETPVVIRVLNWQMTRLPPSPDFSMESPTISPD
jgi:4'-phosphopantetheinyl transferase